MHIQAEDGIFTLETDHTAYQFKADKYGVLNHLWYGPKTGQRMDYLLDYPDIGFSGSIDEAGNDRTYSLDTRLQEYPVSGTGDFRVFAASMKEPGGYCHLDLRYQDFEVLEGAPQLEGMPHLRSHPKASTLKVRLQDTTGQLEVDLYYVVYPHEDAIVRFARFHNVSQATLMLEAAASLSLDFMEEDLDLIHFHGHHNQERSFERVPIPYGIQEISSRRGTSSHQHNPAVILASKETSDTYGSCTGLLLVYSGNYKIQLEKDQLGQVRAVMGLNPDTFVWELEPEGSFTTPQAVMIYSSHGFDTLSQNFHHLINRHLIHPNFQNKARPVLINNWEATYFDFNKEKILDIAQKASSLGIEMLVLDDGWFGKRNSDVEGLGDWFVNEEKMQGSLGELIDQVNGMGMQFGLWIEPEMVSEASQLYQDHPEWALQIPGHGPVRGRYQLVLDFSNPQVVDYLDERLSDILAGNNISYIKWDMNRSITDWYSPALPAHRQKELAHRYVLGVYDLLERLRSKFPHILFEGCSGGGGRFDAGMLYYTPQIWTSDDTDAHERCFIQHGTSFFYPISTMGSHVSAVPNHQTGRQTSMDARAAVAMQGSFGYELDLNTISKEEQEKVKKHIRLYRHFQPLIYQGDFYRLSHPQKDGGYVWEYVSPDKEEVLIQGLLFETRPTRLRQRVHLKGLDPQALYALEMVNFEKPEEPISITGKALMEGGLLLPWTWGTDVPVQIYLKKVENKT